MKPTTYLRFVKRKVQMPEPINSPLHPSFNRELLMREVRILQQFFSCHLHDPTPANPAWLTIEGRPVIGEWRDVEEVEE